MINKLFGRYVAKVAILAVAGGFATGGLVAAGAFTGGAPPHEAAHVAGATAVTLATSSSAGAMVASENHPGSTSTVDSNADEHQNPPTATPTPGPVPPTPTVQDNDADEGVTGTAEANDPDDVATGDHGNCVAYAASILRTLGLAGEQNGAFISLVARDKTAVTARVAAGGTPDAACATAIAKAKVAALAAAVTDSADDHGDDGSHHDGGHHDGSHHDGNDDKGGITPTAATTGDSTGESKAGRD